MMRYLQLNDNSLKVIDLKNQGTQSGRIHIEKEGIVKNRTKKKMPYHIIFNTPPGGTRTPIRKLADN